MDMKSMLRMDFKTATKTDMKSMLKMDFKTATKTEVKTDMKSMLKMDTRFISAPSLPQIGKISPSESITPQKPVAPKIPILQLPAPSFARRRTKTKEKAKRTYRYTPSFAAISLGIFGKRAKKTKVGFTGFEIRPIEIPTIEKKKKKKKHNKRKR